jgi:thiol:disulfide interchange protein
MIAPFRILALAAFACLGAPSAHAAQDFARTDQAEVRLIAATTGFAPGQSLDLGVAFRLAPGWHIYAENPGDAGLPTTVAWTLPQGASISPLIYPAHKRFDEAGLTTYGYDTHAVFTARATTPTASAPFVVGAKVSWLVCKEICIPGEANLSLTLPVAAGTPQPSFDALEFTASSAAAAPLAPPAPDLGVWLALGLAFAGGVLLNLMPCVFPILALKVLAIAQAARAAARRDGLLFGAGVLAGFAVLGGALAGVGAGGAALGWGFQLQSPAVVLVLALVMLLVGLDLADVLPMGGLPAGLTARLPAARAPFFTGLLAVAVASPCTAPFMGAAVGFAAVQTPLVGFGVILAVGVGFALPMVLLGLSPALARLMPRPGPWMNTLRHVLAWPMFAAALWLAWVLSRQTDTLGLWIAALVVVVIALAASLPRVRKVSAALILIAAVGAAVVVELRPAPSLASAETAYSDTRLAALQAEGKPVFVDFTAAWCLTCQVNKRTTLADAKVLKAFADKGVTLLVADWTQRDAEIGAALARLGRAGVPAYALYAPGNPTPTMLPELLTPGVVLDALSGLSP